MSLLKELGLRPTKAMAEAARRADAAMKKSVADATKAAGAAQDQLTAPDRSGGTDELDAAVKKARNTFARHAGFGGVEEEEEVTEPRSDTATKGKFKPIVAGGKGGGGFTVTRGKESHDGRGGKSTRGLAFGGKAWVEYAAVEGLVPAEYDLTFHFEALVKGSLGAEKKPLGDQGGRGHKVEASASATAQVSFSMKHRFDSAALKKYVAAVDAGGKGGEGHVELRLAALASSGIVDDLGALVAQARSIGGSASGMLGMADGDESELKVGGGAEGEATLGWKGLGASLGASVSGSLARHIRREGDTFAITLTESADTTRHGAVSGGASGVGMTVGVEKNAQQGESVTFELDAKHPKAEDLAKRILAAKTVAEMRALRRALPDVPSYDTRTKSSGSGTKVGVSIAGVSLGVGGSERFGETVTEGPGGKKASVYAGGGGVGAGLKVGKLDIAKVSRDDNVTAGADSDNRGFGEATTTDTESSIVGAARELLGKGKEVDTAAGVLTGDEEVDATETHIQGVALDDESFVRVARLARSGSAWEACWRGALDTLLDWRKLRHRVAAAGDDRAAIARALAGFGKGKSRGRHDTLRIAVTGVSIPFEYPDEIHAKKAVFDDLVIDNPLPDALAAGGEVEVLGALQALETKLVALRGSIAGARRHFRRPDDCLDMCQRIDLRLRQVRQLLAAQHERLGAVDHEEGVSVEQFESLPEPTDEQRAQADAAERVEELKEQIREAAETEAQVFATWADDNLGEDGWLGRSKPDTGKLNRHADTLKRLYKQWDTLVAELRKALAEAGPNHDPSEADAVVPNRPMWWKLRRQHPQAGWLQD